MAEFETEQESFWAGRFGDEYVDRNSAAGAVAANIAFFSRALAKAAPIRSCIEFGANVGLNLRALRALYPDQEQFAVEINAKAAAELRRHAPAQRVFETSILEFDAARLPHACDLSFVKGVLIHINPEQLNRVYAALYAASARYVMLGEYYNPTPVTVAYRGHAERLFKRDFAGEMMDAYPDLELLDYGFAYRRDRCFPQDDITWFLLEKR